MDIKIFPYVFGRTCSAPFSDVEHFVLREYDQLLDSFSKITTFAEKIKGDVVEMLESKIKLTNNDETRKQLLNLKRDVFNDRDIRRYLLNKEIQHEEQLLNILNAKIDIDIEYSDLIKEISFSINENINQSILYLKKKTLEPYFINGLLFSTSSLVYEHSKLLNSDKDDRKMNKKEKSACLSLLRYYLRSATKTTPFSSFNSVFLNRKVGNRLEPVSIENNVSKIKITNVIFLIIKELFEADDDLRDTLLVSTNPTISHIDRSYEFFYNDANNEGFYKVNENEVLNFITDFFKDHRNNNVTYNFFIKEFCKVTDESPENISHYVTSLIEQGIIILHFTADIKEYNWPNKLLNKFRKLSDLILNNTTLEKLIFVLTSLVSTANKLESISDFRTRKGILNKCFKLVISELLSMENLVELPRSQKIINKLTPPDLFYEDTFSSFEEEIDIKSFENSLEKISKLNAHLTFISYKNELRKKIADTISENNFEENRVSLMQFYRDFFLKTNANDYNSLLDYQIGYYTAFENFFKALKLITNEEKIDLYSYFKPEDKYNIVSLDIFTQIGKVDRKDTLIINNISNCFITSTSRFLNYFESLNIAEEVKNIYRKTYKNCEVCELVDSSIHNTNSIPYFTNKIIDVSLKRKQLSQYNLNELFISINSFGQPILVNNAGKRVIPLDFSMEGISRKSSLMRFIDLFSDANNEGLTKLIEFYEINVISLSPKESDFVFVPRLYYTDEVVLSRKKWIIKKRFLDELLSNETNEPIQFVNFNSWRKKQDIPHHVFVKDKRSKNQSKPQYIDFRSPLLFRLFERIVAKADEMVEVVEMLPAPGQMTIGNLKNDKVNELIFSIY